MICVRLTAQRPMILAKLPNISVCIHFGHDHHVDTHNVQRNRVPSTRRVHFTFDRRGGDMAASAAFIPRLPDGFILFIFFCLRRMRVSIGGG